MRLGDIIKKLDCNGFLKYHFKEASIKLENGVRIVYNTINSGECCGIDNLNCIIAYNQDKILDSVKIDTYNDNSEDIHVWLDFLKKFKKNDVEDFNVLIYTSGPNTEVRIRKTNSINSLDCETTISDSIIIN